MRLHQRQERLPPLQEPIPTQMVVSAASVASVLVRCYGLLLKATSEHEERPAPAHRLRVHRVHHVQGEARGVHGLLTAVRSATEAATEPAAALRLELAVSLIRPALTGRMQASSCKPLGYRQG